MNNTHTPPLSFEEIIDSHLTLLTRLISNAQQAQPPTPQHLNFLISLQTHYQTHIDHLFDSLHTLTLHQRSLFNIIPTSPLLPSPFLPLDDDLVDAIAYTPPISVESLSISSANPSPTIPQRTPWPPHCQSRKPHFPPTQTIQVLRH